LNPGNVPLHRKKRSQYAFRRGSSIEVYNPAEFSKKRFNHSWLD